MLFRFPNYTYLTGVDFLITISASMNGILVSHLELLELNGVLKKRMRDTTKERTVQAVNTGRPKYGSQPFERYIYGRSVFRPTTILKHIKC